MKRDDYLKMCREVSMLPDGAMHIKAKVPEKFIISFNGTDYYPYGYEMHFENGAVLNMAVLHDLRANSVTYAPVEKINLKVY